MNDIIIFIFIITAFFFVMLLSKALQFADYAVEFKNPVQDSMISMLAILIIIISVVFNGLFTSKVIFGIKYTFIANFANLLPVILICYFKHDSFKSVGITKVNLLKSILLGCSLVLFFYLTVHFFISPNGMHYSSYYITSLLINYIIVGFFEEIIFRGYLQTRLTASLGKVKGLVLTAILFSLTHLSNGLILQHLNLNDALINSLALLPVSLLLGYIMLKAKNITAPAIFHAGLDWFGQIIIYTM